MSTRKGGGSKRAVWVFRAAQADYSLTNCLFWVIMNFILYFREVVR